MRKPIGCGVVAFGAALIVLWLILAPKLLMLFCLEGDGRAFGALMDVRSKVSAFREKNGRLPSSLAEVGIPNLKLRSFDSEREVLHRHRRIAEEELRPGAGLEGFRVHFTTYVPHGHARSVSVVGDFNGFDRDKGRMTDSAGTGYGWDLEAELKPGTYSFRFVIDGREGPLETALIDHAGNHPNVYATHAELRGDPGKWIYDPQTGLVVLGCSGVDTKHRRPWYNY